VQNTSELPTKFFTGAPFDKASMPERLQVHFDESLKEAL